jgi:hypothetical protein
MTDPSKLLSHMNFSLSYFNVLANTFATMLETWILFVMAVGAQVPNSAITSFTSQIIQSFGFDALGSQYLQIPGGAVQFLSLILGGWLCSKWPRGSRCPTMIVANTICIVGAALLVRLPDENKVCDNLSRFLLLTFYVDRSFIDYPPRILHKTECSQTNSPSYEQWGRLVALWLCFFQGLGFSMSLTMISSNIAGSTKKQLTAGILFTGYCVGKYVSTISPSLASLTMMLSIALNLEPRELMFGSTVSLDPKRSLNERPVSTQHVQTNIYTTRPPCYSPFINR